MSRTMFYMWESQRQSLMAEHCCYVEQASKRLLSQFMDIESEADRATETYLENSASQFDPNRHDPSDFYEAARDEGVAFYRLLSDMRERTRLSVTAGMYQELDKQLRDWLTKEIRHWHGGKNLADAVWNASFEGIMNLLDAIGWPVTKAPYYAKLDALHLVVNVFKHGKGNSLTSLSGRYPEYLKSPFAELNVWSTAFQDHTDLRVKDDQIGAFSEAILAFWKDVPERITDDSAPNTDLPDWFEKAWKKDHSARKIHERPTAKQLGRLDS